MTTDAKLSASASWLFVLGSIVAGIGASYALAGAGIIASAGAYFVIVLVGAALATRKTLATAGSTIGRVLVLAIAASIAYFVLIHHAVHTAAVSTTDIDAATADKAGAVVGSAFGTIVAIATFVETLIAGIIGALIGARGR
ncbi:MAG TPA: hypothetical protein VGG28_29120 [Kofleriaceae bacterium]|jgi:hypothetical protein